MAASTSTPSARSCPRRAFPPRPRSPPGTNDLSLELKGERFGQFQGARVSTTLSGQSRSLDQDPETSARLENDMARLIRTGKILWTEPNQTVSRKDLFDKSGEPYRRCSHHRARHDRRVNRASR